MAPICRFLMRNGTQAIERRLVELSAGGIPVDSLVVVALPDARAGHRLVPVFDAAVGRPPADALLEKYAGQAPGYARLDPPVLLDPFPRTELGKPRRAECMQQLAGRA